ncbi:MAG: fused MFS/spermidine synthase [Myxococcales bacterium]|nr:fused MFS/spermidine synthase [Myxococcales bacterium]
MQHSRAPSRIRRRALLGATAGAALGWLARPRAAGALAPGVVLEDVQSTYNHVRVVEHGAVRTMYFIGSNGMQYIESRLDRARPTSLDLDYTRTMMAGFLFNPAPRRLLMLGVGGGQMSNYLYARFPSLEIDAVDIDPEVIRLAIKYFGVPADDSRYRTHAADARVFVERARPEVRWDIIMLDAFRGVFVPYHLKTFEFYRACLERLTPGGVVVANLHNITRMYPHDRQTLAAVFPQRYSFVSEGGNQTTFVASASPRRVGLYAIRQGARAAQPRFDMDMLGLASRYYYRTDWETSYEVLHDDFKPDELERAAERHNETCIRNCRYTP